ncbi:hypothetical protein [Actinomadura formosensis]|uniref:hypothetical protein n=1 Tax=Actinomadura formosensis TaxID=60706 RepID=UPI003D8A5E0E
MAALAIASSILIAVAGWLVSQWQARQAIKRNMYIDYLLKAYRRLDDAANRPLEQGSRRDIESAISDIGLLGSPSQVELAKQIADTWAASGNTDLLPLLADLRTSLRKELRLESARTPYFALRLGDPTSADRHVGSADQAT